MSNIKEVIIEGWMPFDANDNPDLLNFLGKINLPANGLKLSHSGKTKMIPQRNGGQYYYYEFAINGTEAINWEYLKSVVKTMLDSKCIVERAMAKDLEEAMDGHGQWCFLYPPINPLEIYEHPKPEDYKGPYNYD